MTEMTQTLDAYGEALLELGGKRREIVVVDSDLYKSTRTVLFRDAFPERFIDIGIAPVKPAEFVVFRIGQYAPEE